MLRLFVVKSTYISSILLNSKEVMNFGLASYIEVLSLVDESAYGRTRAFDYLGAKLTNRVNRWAILKLFGLGLKSQWNDILAALHVFKAPKENLAVALVMPE